MIQDVDGLHARHVVVAADGERRAREVAAEADVHRHVGVVGVQFCFLCCCISRRSRIVTIFSCCSLFKCESV